MSTPAQYINPALSGYNIYQGATSGNPLAQARAAANATKLGNNLYNTTSGTPPSGLSGNINTGATGALDALGVYSGLQQGGWQGDTRAGASALQGAGLLANNPALSTVGGAILAPLDLYNEINSYRSGATGSDAMSGAETGAAIGSIVPGIGTAIGGLIGGAAGALSSAFGPGEKDPETAGVQGLINATSANQNNSQVAGSVQDPYTALAGLMDERSSTLPMYQQYGRMGEQKFTNDMTGQINDAFTPGQGIQTGGNQGDTWSTDPQGNYVLTTPTGGKTIYAPSQGTSEVYNSTVAPWVEGMGSGYKGVGPTYAATTQGLLQDMTGQYLSGQATNDWKAVGGDSPFASIYNNSPFTAAPAATQAKAEGGHVNSGNTRDKLRKLYEGSFANRKTHFSDGGGNDYVSYFTPSIPTSLMYDQPSVSDVNYEQPQLDNTNFNNSLSDEVAPLTSQSAVNQVGNQSGLSQGSVLGQGGALSGLGSALGVSSMGQLLQQYGALAPLLAAALGGNKQASAPATPAGYGAIPSIATPSYSRPYTQPNVANWYTYGEGPEQSFFGNNQLPNVPGVSPAQSAQPSASSSAPPPTAPAVPASNPNMSAQPIMGGPQPIMRARGGAFDSTQGDSYVQDPGHGDGTSDGIDAKLSGGEYVMDAGTVSMLGNGSNEAGSRALDQLRQRIRKHAGKQLVKGKQFMKSKPPESYLRGAKEPS